MVSKTLAIFALACLITSPASASFLNSIADGISSAAGTVSNGVGDAANAVGSGINTATNAVGSGINTAANATGNAVSTAANETNKFVNTAVGGVKDIYNVSSNQVRNWTSDVRDALSSSADSVSNAAQSLGSSVVSVSTGAYDGVVHYGKNITGNNDSPSGAQQNQNGSTTDATSATSIISAITANSTGYIAVANSLLVGLGQNRTADIQSAIKNIVNNSTGNTSYPATAVNETVSLGLAEAIVTSLVTANNYTVTVDFNGQTNRVNVTQVGDVFIAGLQDGLAPCARNVSSSTNAASGSSEYFTFIASRCCYLVAQPLTYTYALSQSNGVGDQFETSLRNSQNLGNTPALDLTRCLSNTTSTS